MTTYPLSDEDREIQERTRRFVDERADPVGGARRGERRPDPRRGTHEAPRPGGRARLLRDEHADRARGHRHDRRCSRCSCPNRSAASRTRSAGACTPRPHGRRPSCREHQMQTLDPADDPRRAARVLRDHRGRRRQRRRRDRGDRPPRRRRVRAQRREDARDVVQQRELLLLPGEDRRRAERGRARDVLRRQGRRPACGSCASPRTRTPTPTPTRSSRSTTCACRPRTSSARKATAWPSPTSGSATSG